MIGRGGKLHHKFYEGKTKAGWGLLIPDLKELQSKLRETCLPRPARQVATGLLSPTRQLAPSLKWFTEPFLHPRPCKDVLF
ncbi:hypothetical protein D3A96_13865 [Robertkochia marina]|nr:hypothetical protein D3A96_13865 [Robertkochia marina]